MSSNGASTVGEYLDARGLSADDLAGFLSSALGREITPRGVTVRKGRAMPKNWAAALDGTSQPEAEGAPSPADGPDARTVEQPPKAPPDAPRASSPVELAAFAEKRIAAVYGLVGAGVGNAVGNPGVEKVWDDHSGEIAKAWLAAAETSPFARRVVDVFTAGGPMGEVVMLHITMLAGTLYVVGQFPEVGLFAKYRGYRPRPAADTRADDGAASDSPADRVGVPAGAAS